MILSQYEENVIDGGKLEEKGEDNKGMKKDCFFFSQLLKFSVFIVVFKSYGMSKKKYGQCSQICDLNLQL